MKNNIENYNTICKFKDERHTQDSYTHTKRGYCFEDSVSKLWHTNEKENKSVQRINK